MSFFQNLFLFSSEWNTRLVPPNTNLSWSLPFTWKMPAVSRIWIWIDEWKVWCRYMNHCSFFCNTMHLIHEFRYRCYIFYYNIHINSLKIIRRQIPGDHCSGTESDPFLDTEKYQDHMDFELLKDHSLYQEFYYP